VFWTQRPLDERIRLLETDVDALVSGGAVNASQGRALDAKLEAARGQIARGRNAAAINQLQAFVNQTRALASGGILAPEDAAALGAEAQSIIAQAAGEDD